MDPDTGVVTDTGMPKPATPLLGNHCVNWMAVAGSGEVLAVRDRMVWRLDGTTWSSSGATLPEQIKAFEVDRTPGAKRIFVAVDGTGPHILQSEDYGATWTDVSGGLPKTLRCSDLRFADGGDGSTYLYLSTYGRAVWVAQLARAPQSKKEIVDHYSNLAQQYGIPFEVLDGVNSLRVDNTVVSLGMD
jgi:hypothetical protein